MSDESLSAAPVGSVLQQARESLGMTQREVGEILHVSQSIVDAVERGDKNRLPAFVYTRGYVRAYARLLELDADGLVAVLALQYGESQSADDAGVIGVNSQVGGPAASKLSGLAQELLRHPQVIGGLAVAGLLVVAVAFLFAGDEAEEVPRAADEVQLAPQQQDAAQPESPEPSMPQPDAGGEVSNELAEPALAETEPSGTVRRLTAIGENQLSLSINEDCWIEIKDIEGNLLYGDLGRAGQIKQFIGAGPFQVKLGYAPGVTMRFNGEPVVLSPHTRSNIASLVIGQ